MNTDIHNTFINFSVKSSLAWNNNICTNSGKWSTQERSERDEVSGDFRIEELQVLHRSSNILRVVKSRRLKWAWPVAWLTETRNGHSFLGECQISGLWVTLRWLVGKQGWTGVVLDYYGLDSWDFSVHHHVMFKTSCESHLTLKLITHLYLVCRLRIYGTRWFIICGCEASYTLPELAD
jgi:hypothetical protein